jgi:hypothetical protein
MFNDYDMNVWSQDPTTMSLTAYRQELFTEDGKQYVQTDTSESTAETITFSIHDNLETVKYLIEEEDPMQVIAEGLTDYDDWVSIEFLTRGPIPTQLAEWLGALPEYTPTLKENA